MSSIRPACRVSNLSFLAWLVVFASPTTVSAAPYSTLFVFGDSFSDSGNVYLATGGLIPPDPPYFQGRFSDGPVWVEHLAQRLGLEITANGHDPTVVAGNNFAVGGARCVVDIPVGELGTIPSAVSQVRFFVDAVGTAPPNALYVVFCGHNDLRFAADPGEGLAPAEREQVALEAIEGIRVAITELAAAGARVFLVPNIADLGVTPEARVERKNAAEVTAMTLLFNGTLAPVLDELETTLEVEILQLDVYTLANEVVDDALDNGGRAYGITNVDVPIFRGHAGSPGADPEVSLFSDSLHVSAAAHALLGYAAFSLIEAENPALGGWQVPGDCNQDGTLDVSDAICAFGVLFLGDPPNFPCGDGTPRGPANVALLDWQPDGFVDVSDGVSLLQFLFGGGNAHPRAVPAAETSGCTRIAGCPDALACP